MASIEDLQKEILRLTSEIHSRDQVLHAKELEFQAQKREILLLNKRIESLIFQVSQELELALKLQRRLSPVDLPHLSGFEFSSKFNYGSKFGGDYFDVFELAEKMKFAAILSSCSGYAVSALLLSVLMRDSLNRAKSNSVTAVSQFERLASELSNEMGEADTCSLVYLLVDRRSFELEVVGCGAVRGIFYKATSDSAELLQWPEQAMAKSGPPGTASLKYSLQPRDRIVLFSPGVFKTLNSQNKEFGVDRLLEIVRKSQKFSVHELRNEILFQVEKFSNVSTPLFDQTILVVEVKDRVIKLAKG